MADCYFCRHNIKEIDWKNAGVLGRFISVQAKIKPPRRTGTCAKHQRKLAKAIKRARVMGLLPYTR